MTVKEALELARVLDGQGGNTREGDALVLLARVLREIRQLLREKHGDADTVGELRYLLTHGPQDT